MATIIIKRKSSMLGCAQGHNVYLWNSFVGELKNGGTLVVHADVGTPVLSFRSTMKYAGKNATFKVVVNDPDEVIELQTKFSMSGEYEVAYADNKPHIPVGVNATPACYQPTNVTTDNAVRNTIANESTGIHCPRCGCNDVFPVSEVSTKGKDFDASDACCGYLLCGPIGLLCGATGKGKQTITTTYWLCKGCGKKFQL